MNPFLKEYHTDKEDKDLIEKTLKGQKQSLEILLKKHQPYIFNIAWKMVQNPIEAEDITQEVIIKVITNLSKFEGKSAFRTWLYRIVVNHFLQVKRSQKEECLTEGGFSEFSNKLDEIADTEISEIEQQEKQAEIREMNLGCMSGMLLCLTREQRLVYILGELFNADHTLGAEILGISKGNFRVRLSRSRKDLLSFMNNKCGLVNKLNPCRCYKKVTTMIDSKVIDSKALLFNRKEYADFQDYISDDADEMLSLVEESYRELHHELPFKKNFNKKTFLQDFLKDERVINALNLN